VDMNPATSIDLTKTDKSTLEGWVKAPSTPQGLVMKAKIILLFGQGALPSRIAKKLKTSRPTVALWKKRFKEEGINGLKKIKKGRGRKPVFKMEKVKAIIESTLHEKPKDATHWSTRSMAKHQNVGHLYVQKVWQANNLKPHLVKTFKLSNDKHFIEKLKDVVGLYLNPPENALVFCVDEKTQIQALDRTQPSLPMKRGRAETVTHDYKRNGTTTLFAALDVLKGEVIGECMQRHRNKEFLKFLKRIDQATDKDLDVHCIMDNYGTHKHPNVKAWLAKHPRFHFHFIPTSSSWLNLVERWFGEITRKRIRRGTFKSVPELEAAIHEFIACNNASPKPFVWTKKAEDIIEKVNRCKAILQTSH